MSRSPLGLAALAFLALVAGACQKRNPPPPEPTPAPPAEPAVAIDDVVPARTVVGRPVTVTVTGRGFQDGMRVTLGGSPAVGLDVVGPRELTLRATETLPVGAHDLVVERADGEQARRQRAFTVEPDPMADGNCRLATILFELDEATLSNEARRLLAENARCIEARRLPAVRLEGHADERGSTVYNLSLGERRAEAVRAYLLNIGVGSAKLTNLSYGEERPVDGGSTEAAWARNRRVELVVP